MAQGAADQIARIRAMYQQVVADSAKYHVVLSTRAELGLEQRSVNGGMIAASCLGAEVPRILAEDDGDNGPAQIASFYFDHDSLFFAFYRDGFDIPQHPVKWHWDEERLYFANGKLIRRIVNGGVSDGSSAEEQDRAKAVLLEAEQYHSLVEGCKPKSKKTTADRVSDADDSADLYDHNSVGYAHVTAKAPGGESVEAYCTVLGVRVILAHVEGDVDRYYFDLETGIFSLAVRQSQRFYFYDTTMIRWADKGIEQDLTSTQARRWHDQWLSNARQYEPLVMPLCSPPKSTRK